MQNIFQILMINCCYNMQSFTTEKKAPKEEWYL